MSKVLDKQWPVNWVDGMNINQAHFVAEHISQVNKITSSTKSFVTPFNYGIETSIGNELEPVFIDVVDNISVDVVLADVRVLFPGGYHLQINAGNDLLCKYSESLKSVENHDVAYLVLGVDYTQRRAYGLPDEEEVPMRKPFVVPETSLSLVPDVELEDAKWISQHIVIGRLVKNEDQWLNDDTYIVPAINMGGQAALTSLYYKFENYLSSIDGSIGEIIQKIRIKNQNNILAEILFDMANQLSRYLSTSMASFRIKGLHEPVIETIIPFMDMARLINHTLNSYQGCGKDEMLTYLADWCDLSQAEFEACIHELITLKYKHNDIEMSIRKVERFADMVSSMFVVLASLDIIGKKVETDLFVAEENSIVEEEGTTNRKRKFSLLGK